MHKIWFLCVILCVLHPSKTEDQNSTELPKETTKKQDKYSQIINILKSVITNEDEENETQEERPISSEELNENSLYIEENKPLNDTEENSYKEALDKIINKITTAIESNKANVRNNITKNDLPNMIPIFKPIPQVEYEKVNKDLFKTSEKQIDPKQKLAPLKMNPNDPKVDSKPKAHFKIPCQRAADVLDMRIPNEAKEVNGNLESVTRVTKASTNQAKQKCGKDDTVAMLFKPETLTLMEVYGNILKKITVTVLVPYHVSKMAGKGLN